MKTTSAILNKIIVKTFYREQAGFFFFIFLVFFGAVAPSMQLAYHYSLIRGMLEAPAFLALVALAWLLYAGKVLRFVQGVLRAPEYLFLYKLRDLPQRRLYGYFVRIQLWLLLPVWGYALAVTGVAWQRNAPGVVVGIPLYVLSLVLGGAARYTYRFGHPGGRSGQSRQSGALHRGGSRFIPYWSILGRFLLTENGWLLVGIKLFSCGTLYALLYTQTSDDYDLRLAYFVFSLALFGHGLLLYRCRGLEMTRGLWYRNLPVPRRHRFAQIALFCGVLLIPEMLMLAWLTPHPIRMADSWSFILSGYSIILLLYMSAATVAMGDYLKVCLVLFGILYACVLGNLLVELSGLFFLTALMLFWRGSVLCR
jgi:hypothetical protein